MENNEKNILIQDRNTKYYVTISYKDINFNNINDICKKDFNIDLNDYELSYNIPSFDKNDVLNISKYGIKLEKKKIDNNDIKNKNNEIKEFENKIEILRNVYEKINKEICDEIKNKAEEAAIK